MMIISLMVGEICYEEEMGNEHKDLRKKNIIIFLLYLLQLNLKA